MALPTVRHGASVALYPLTQSDAFVTVVQQFCDDSEQRWLTQAAGLAKFALTYNNINSDDVNALLAFWRTEGGPTWTWDATIGGTTYHNMYFLGDSFELTEPGPGLFKLVLSCAQELHS
jgi:hypothetical protein